jgi:hypothetical protein
MDSANTDPELRDWLRWASEEGNAPAFVRTVAQAALIACSTDYELLRPVMLELKRRHPDTRQVQMRTNAPNFLDIGVSKRV